MRAMVVALALVAAQTVQAGVLTERIAKDFKVLGTDSFAGGERTRFEFEGCEAWVVEPPTGVAVAEGRPWTWTMQWATAFVSRTPVSKLLARGWHHVTVDTFKHRMDETGLEITRKYQDYLVDKLGFAPKACLIGMSWGGFFSTRYAAYCPGRVQAICYDAPLMNFEKGGYTDGRGEGPWTKRVPPEGWTASPEMPVNMAGAIAAQGIPVLLLYGGVDRVVPPEQNCEIFIPRYRRLGGENLKVVRRGFYAHHPHGVEETDMSVANFFMDAFKRPVVPAKPRFSVFGVAVRRIMKDRAVDLKAAAKLLLDAGIGGFDTDYKDPVIPEYIAAGLKPASLYGFVKFDTEDLGVAESSAFVDAAVKYGAKRVMVLPDSFKPGASADERERVTRMIVRGLSRMCTYAAKKDVLVMVEDFGDRNNICSDGTTMETLFASEPRLSYALDSGNFYYAGHGTDVVAFARQWKDRIAHVHLKDQAKEDAHAYRTLGEGAVPNTELLRLVGDLGYVGWYTIENPVGDDCLKDIVRQRDFILEALRGKSIPFRHLLSVREFDALERTARPKSMFVDGYVLSELSKRAVAAGAYAGEEEPPLAKRIAEKWPVVKTDEWKTDEWYGGRRTVFTFKGHEAWVVEPPAGVTVAKGCPWTWTMQWASDFVPRTGVPRLLSLGYRHVTLMQYEERMTEEGLRLSKEFQAYLVNDLGFAPKANLIGLSWGGFFTVRYASTYPELVNKIYLDAPLLTFEGMKHEIGPWKDREPAGGWRDDPEMPVNRAAALAKTEIPILLAYGCSDTVVDPATNCLAFAKAYEAAGGKKLKMVPRANFTHHPHGFDVGNGEISCFFYFNNK